MRIQLSEHFTYPKLLRFVFPSIVTMIFTSVYSIIDGLFVSNFVGKTSFAALNLIFPLLMVFGALGFMMGSGGSAIVGKALGEKKEELANQYFSMITAVTFGAGMVVCLVGQIFIRQIAIFLGAEGSMIGECVIYGRILLASTPCFMLQYIFQTFFVTAEKPKLGLVVTVAAGCVNIFLDFLFVAVFQWGLAGAALATALSQTAGGLLPIGYFLRKNDSLLRFTRFSIDGAVLLKTCANGSSELMSNIAASVVTMLYNYQLMRLAGENGVAAYGVIAYVAFIFAAIFLGYAIGSAPIISYDYGAQNHEEMKNMFQKSVRLNLAVGAVMMIFAVSISNLLARLFVGYDQELCALTSRGLRLYSISFLLSGFNIFSSSFFTALNNGGISAAISFLRTMVFEVGSVLILPMFLDVDGIWLAILVAETGAMIVSAFFMMRNRRRYHYA